MFSTTYAVSSEILRKYFAIFLRARRGTKMAHAAISLCFSTRAAPFVMRRSSVRFRQLAPYLKACGYWAAGLFCFCGVVCELRHFAAVFGVLRQKNGTKMAQNGRLGSRGQELIPPGVPLFRLLQHIVVHIDDGPPAGFGE